MDGTKKIKSTSFHQYSCNSEVETTWISWIGWHHKISNIYYYVYALKLKKLVLASSTLCFQWKNSNIFCSFLKQQKSIKLSGKNPKCITTFDVVYKYRKKLPQSFFVEPLKFLTFMHKCCANISKDNFFAMS